MFISKKLLALVTGFGTLVLTNAVNPMQVVLKNLEYENQGYRILQNKNVEGYSVRIKNTLKSCEDGVQVNNK
jgi:hypothetical protein